VSIVAFYDALGIKDYSFYSLMMSGMKGVVLMAWRHKDKAITYLMERNVREFDLSSPLQAFHLATFLMRLRTDQEKLK
ncbi:hypothetical protein B0H10DRAFT_1765677, partial [Mycena sp. CBHHK59/15]